MKKLREIPKKYYNSFINNEKNIRVKLNISFFLSAILLFGVLLLKEIDNKSIYVKTIEFISALFFAFWLLTTTKPDSTYNAVLEFSKVVSLLFCLPFSLEFWYTAISDKFSLSLITFFPLALLASLTTLWCMYFITCKFLIITSTIRSMFDSFKSRLFDNSEDNNKKPSLLIKLIETVTAFLVALGGLALSIVTIIGAIASIYSYFIPPVQ